MYTAADTDADAMEGPVSSAPSFEAFYLEHHRQVFAAMWLVTKSSHEAEEITQEAFLKVLERWNRVVGMDDPAGYVFRIATNVWRSRGRRAAVALRRTARSTPSADQLELAESRADVVRVLAVLSPRQRAALVLVDLVGLSSEDAGKALGMRASTVRVQAARARAALKEGIQAS